EDEKVLIMTGGSSGHGLSEEFFDRLTTKIESDGLKKFRILVVTGKNKELFEKLRLSKNPHLLAFGFYERMLELYAVADVFAGKPGGLSTAEGLKHRLPMVITSWLPGMEELNVEFLTKKNLTLPIIPFGPEHDAKVIEQISLELRTGEFKQKLLARNDEIKALANDDPTIICRFIGKVLSQRFAETAVRQQT
ncbi:MAG: glycosyltransferase, partial [Acidobacteriaceae bacterium]